MMRSGRFKATVLREYGKWVVGLVLVIIVAAAAMAHHGETVRLRRLHQDRESHLASQLQQALGTLAGLHESAVGPIRVSATGDTVSFNLHRRNRREAPEIILVYVDTHKGGLWIARGDHPPEQLASAVDRLRLDPDAQGQGPAGFFVEVSASWPGIAGPAMRRSLCRYVVAKAPAEEDRG